MSYDHSVSREELPTPQDESEDEEDLEEDDDLSDPNHPDHDLSEWSPYSPGVDDTKPWFVRRWVMIVIGILVIIGLIIPVIPR
jgi:hypothetical protein